MNTPTSTDHQSQKPTTPEHSRASATHNPQHSSHSEATNRSSHRKQNKWQSKLKQAAPLLIIGLLMIGGGIVLSQLGIDWFNQQEQEQSIDTSQVNQLTIKQEELQNLVAVTQSDSGVLKSANLSSGQINSIDTVIDAIPEKITSVAVSPNKEYLYLSGSSYIFDQVQTNHYLISLADQTLVPLNDVVINSLDENHKRIDSAGWTTDSSDLVLISKVEQNNRSTFYLTLVNPTSLETKSAGELSGAEVGIISVNPQEKTILAMVTTAVGSDSQSTEEPITQEAIEQAGNEPLEELTLTSEAEYNQSLDDDLSETIEETKLVRYRWDINQVTPLNVTGTLIPQAMGATHFLLQQEAGLQAFSVNDPESVVYTLPPMEEYTPQYATWSNTNNNLAITYIALEPQQPYLIQFISDTGSALQQYVAQTTPSILFGSDAEVVVAIPTETQTPQEQTEEITSSSPALNLVQLNIFTGTVIQAATINNLTDAWVWWHE